MRKIKSIHPDNIKAVYSAFFIFIMAYFVYILQSEKDGKFYIGSSQNVEKRLAFHNAGLQRSTRNRIPFRIVLVETVPSKKEALVREKQIKSYKGGEAFKKLIQGV